jgi:hypothetical protein
MDAHTKKSHHRFKPYYDPPVSTTVFPTETLVIDHPTTNITIYPLDSPVAESLPKWIKIQSHSVIFDGKEVALEDNIPSKTKLIPRPDGEAGRSGSGSFNLQRALGITDVQYRSIRVDSIFSSFICK